MSVSPLVIFITFAVFNWILSSVKIRLLHVAIAGLVTTVLFKLVKFTFILYLSFFLTHRLLYGTLLVILFLARLYVSWTIILLRAEVNNMTGSVFLKNIVFSTQ